MNTALKHFWLSGAWAPPPAVLKWKPLRDPSVGLKEFKPPEWEVFAP
jgi:hypothetical protein